MPSAVRGPAGRLLDEALEVGGDRPAEVYVTNAVKHFKFVRQELVKHRLHKKPSAAEVRACNPWLREEVRLVGPKWSWPSAAPPHRRCSATRSG